MAQTGNHTPGPWDVTTVDHSSGGSGAVPSTLFRVGFLSQKDFTGHVADKCHGDSYANARLIAASPEMLSELKRDLQFAREMKKLMEALKGRGWVQYELAVQRIEALETIIARAEGR